MKKHKIKTLAIILLAATQTVSANATTLLEELAVAYENNPRLNAERATLKSNNERMPQALSGFLPTISGNYSRGRENEELTATGLTTKLIPDTKSIQLVQPIFNGGRSYSSVKQAKNLIRSSRARLQQVEQEVLIGAISSFVDVVRAREVLDISINNEKVLQEELEATVDRYELGETTKTDVAQSQSRVSRAESDTIDAEGDLIAANAVYKRTFEVNPPVEMELPTELPEIPETFDEALDKALKKNPFLQSARFDSLAAKDATGVSRADFLPSVDVRGTVSQQRGLSSSVFGAGINSESVTFNVTIPFFQGGAEYSRYRQSKNNLENAEYVLDDNYNGTVNSVTQAWKDIETTIANVRANESAVEAAEIALTGVKEEQQIGSRTTLDVLDAEQELFVARVNLITAKRNRVIAVYNLKAAMGELTAQDLALPTTYYDPKEHYKDVKYQFIGF